MDQKPSATTSKSPTTPMGIPELIGSPTTVFPRTFRFLLISKKYPDFQNLVRRVEIDSFINSITAYVLELTANGKTYPHDWLDQIHCGNYVDDMTLVALDGCGQTLYTLEFEGVKVYDAHVEFNYDDSDVVTHRIGMEFAKMTRLNPKSLDPILT